MRLLPLAYTLSFWSLTFAWTTYVVPHSRGKDDTLALTKALSDPKLATDATILFQKGVIYNILTPIVFPYFENVVVSVQGNLTYAADIKATQAIVGSSSYPGHWFTFNGGHNVTLEGSTDPNWGWANSHGQKWWDAMQQSSAQVNRPNGWLFHGITNGEIKYMKLWQPVAWSFGTTGSQNVRFHHNTIVAISYSKAFPYNTDGFGVQGTDILLEDNIVYNGDDCVTVGSPAKNIHIRNCNCIGGGLSIGSLGKNGAIADVQNILMENTVIDGSLYGAMFKSWSGGNGIARNVTWKNITMNEVKFPIFVTQTFWEKGVDSTKSTQIDTLTFENIRGTINDKWNNHAGISKQSLLVPCTNIAEVATFELIKGSVKSIVAKNINMKTLSGTPVTVACDSTAISNDVGFKCWNGVFQATSAGK